jgi:hypothetical protein
MTAEELGCAERSLACLVAAAYIADNPELFGKEATPTGKGKTRVLRTRRVGIPIDTQTDAGYASTQSEPPVEGNN